MNSFTLELNSDASAELNPYNPFSPLPIFFQEQLNLEGQRDVALPEKFYRLLYQKVTKGKFMFFDEKFSKYSEVHYTQLGLYLSITKLVEAMNTLSQERQIAAKVV